MLNEEFKQRYCADFINSFHNFQNGEQFSSFNNYDENVRERFFDYCFDLCSEENADIDKICEFAYQTVYSEDDVRRTSFLDFCTKLSDISEENAITTFKYCKWDLSGKYNINHVRYAPHYFVNFIKKYPQAFLEAYTPLLKNDIVNLCNLAKIICTDPQTAPVIINYIDNILDQSNPFYLKSFVSGFENLAVTVFQLSRQIVNEHEELKNKLLPTLNKVTKLEFSDSYRCESLIQRLGEYAPNYMFPVMTKAEFSDYLLLWAQNPKINGNALGLLLKYNMRLEKSGPEKTKQNSQILLGIMENKIKNHEIEAISFLPSRGFSESLYKQILDSAEQGISKLDYNSISVISQQFESYQPNEINKNVDILNLLKLTNNLLDNVSSPSSLSMEYEQICDMLTFNVFNGLNVEPEMSKVVYNILSKLTVLKNDEDFSRRFHNTLEAQAGFGLVPVKDLFSLSEKMIENVEFSDDYASSILRFYGKVLDKDLSQSNPILSIIENQFCEEKIKYCRNAKRLLHDIALKLIKTKPDHLTKLLVMYDNPDCLNRNSDNTDSFFQMAMPRLEHLNDVPLTKEVAEEIVQLANTLLRKRKTSPLSVNGLPLLLNLSERVVQNFPEHSGEILTALSKSYSILNDLDREKIDLLANKIISSQKVREKQLLISLLEKSKKDGTPLVFGAKIAKTYWHPVECMHILKEKANGRLLSNSSGIKILDTLIARTADVEPEIRELMPEIVEYSDMTEIQSICKLYVNLFKASKNNLYLNSLKDLSKKEPCVDFNENGMSSVIDPSKKEPYVHFIESGLLQKIIETPPNSEGVRIVLDIVDKQVKADFSKDSTRSDINTDTFLKTCETIINKKLLPANEVCDCIFNSCINISSDKFKILCSSLRRIRITHPKTEPKILQGLVEIAQKQFQSWGAHKIATEIVKVFGDGGDRTAVNIVLTMDKNFEFLKYYAEKTNNFDIFYDLNKKLVGNRKYLDVMIQNIDRFDYLGGKETNDLLITPLRNYAKVAAENDEFALFDDEGKAKDSSFDAQKYQKYDYLNEPNANLKEQSIYGKISDDIYSGDSTNTQTAAVNMVEALIPYVGRVNNREAENLNTAWSVLVNYLPQEKQNAIYERFEDCDQLFYTFTLYMALSSPEKWEKYGKYIADADGHKGLENNPIYNYNLSPAVIFNETTAFIEARPETRPKLEPVLRELIGDNVTDLYFENIDLMSQLRHREFSYTRLINAPTNKAANFLDAFTEKMKDIAAEPEFAGNRDYECLSEAMDNNPNEFNQRAQETFDAMLQEKDKYFTMESNSHNNAFVRNLFPKISNKVDALCEKIGLDDIKECLDYEKRYHKCAVGLYQYNKERKEAICDIEALSEEDKQNLPKGVSSQIVYAMANLGVDNVFWAMNTIKIFQKLNERPETYNSSKNDYPVEEIIPYTKVNMPDWMYKVAIDNQLPQQRLGSVKNLFDKCKAIKRAPHLASWASEAKQIGKMPLWYQVAAGAITAKLHEGVSEQEWKHNLELREIFWQEMKAVQEMGYVKAMQTYIEGGIAYDDFGEPERDSENNYVPQNKETRQAISALLEYQKIENDLDHFHEAINTLTEQGAMKKMFAKENKSKKLDSREIIKANKIIAMRDKFKKVKSKKQKLNAIRDKYSQENVVTTDNISVRKPVDDKISAMRKALLKAKQSKQEDIMPKIDGNENIAAKPINSDTDLLEMVVAKKLTDKIIDKK